MISKHLIPQSRALETVPSLTEEIFRRTLTRQLCINEAKLRSSAEATKLMQQVTLKISWKTPQSLGKKEALT